MSLDLIVTIVCSVLALLAHASRRHAFLTILLRFLIILSFLSELMIMAGLALSGKDVQWGSQVVSVSALLTVLVLFEPMRKAISTGLGAIEYLVSGQLLVKLALKLDLKQGFALAKTFVPQSVPHMVAFWIYVSACGFLLAGINKDHFNMPALPIPVPVLLEQLLTYNGLSLVFLAFCGIGVMISRKFPEAMSRLGWLKPTWPQVGIGLGLVAFTFAYDAIWAQFTHQMPGNLASQLTNYNAGTFTAGGGAGPSFILALFTGICAGVGEETLFRGAVQPALGILPAAILHGLLHGQFSHAPIYIVQVIGWSACMGIVRRYTNTTTTIICHATFNFLTTFLFAFNP